MASADRTEKPSPKKRREAQKQGKVARSRELSSTIVYLGVLFFFTIAGAELLKETQALFRFFWRGFLYVEINPITARELMNEVVWRVVKLAGPLIGLTVLCGLSGTLLQGGLVFSAHPLQFRVEALNPANNLQRIFSKRGLMELAKGVSIVCIVGYLAGSVLWEELNVFQKMLAMDIYAIVSTFGSILYRICFRVGIFLGFLSLADYLFQKYRYEEELKQTKEEVKEDLKESEGQPLVKSRMRRLQRELARRRMMTAVKTADVVITNPTEYAVALKYDMDQMAAPRVVAKGRGYLARKIKEVAALHKIPTVENVPLAQALYKSVEVDGEIPAKLYQAVAQILAYIYKLKASSYF